MVDLLDANCIFINSKQMRLYRPLYMLIKLALSLRIKFIGQRHMSSIRHQTQIGSASLPLEMSYVSLHGAL